MALKFQRARQPEQKEQRRAQILAVATEMVDAGELDTMTLNGLARRVGLAKSNVYRYFETREAILLAVFADDMNAWIDALVVGLGRIRGQRRLESLARVFATTTAAQPRLCQLLSVLGSVLERNVSLDTARAFKRGLGARTAELAEAMHRAVPELTAPQHGELLMHMHGIMIGLWGATHPPPVVQQLLTEPEFAGHHPDFEQGLQRGVLVLARGLAAEPSG